MNANVKPLTYNPSKVVVTVNGSVVTSCSLCAKTAASLSDLEQKLAALRAAIVIGDDMRCEECEDDDCGAAEINEAHEALDGAGAPNSPGEEPDWPLAKRIEALVQFLTAPKEQP